MIPPPPPTVAHLGPDPSTPLPRRLATVTDEVVVVAHVEIDPGSVGVLCERAAELLASQPGVAMLAGVLTDPGGVPHPRPAGLAFTGHLLPDAPTTEQPSRTMVPGPLWAARTAAVAEVGGLDPDLCAPYDQLDLAWSLWAAGHEVHCDPRWAVVAPPPPTRDLEGAAAVRAEAAALELLHRHLDATSLDAALPAAKALSPARLAPRLRGGADPRAGLRLFEASLRHDRRRGRAHRQATRRRPDAEVLGILGPALAADDDDPGFVQAHAEVVARHDLRRFAGRRRVVVATADSLSERMAGPAIRATRIARALAADHEVRMVSATQADLALPGISVERIDVGGDDIERLVDWCDVFVFQGWILARRASVMRSDRIFVADIYDPMHLEALEQSKDGGELHRRLAVEHAAAVLNDQLLRGDFLLCASEKQRDLWLGQLAALGRVNPATYDADPDLRALLSVVPFGIEDEPPVRTGPGFRGVVPGVGPDDPVILWGGGIYNWFDPLTLLHAVDRLRRDHPEVRLVFMGMKHPNPDVPEMKMAVATRELSDRLGLTGTNVVFNEGWVPYGDRQNHLLDADVAVSTHFPHVETAFSFRTRILDYLWAGLPTVCTEGDTLARLVADHDLGRTVPPTDVDALTAALAELLFDREAAQRCRSNIAALTPELRWGTVLEPLVRFLADPRRAPDHMGRLVDPVHPVIPLLVVSRPDRLARDLEAIRRRFREGGPTLVARKLGARVAARMRI